MPTATMVRNPTQQDVSWFIDLYDTGQLNLDPPYQRRSVWSAGDKKFFLDTIFNNYPAPAVYLHKAIDDNGRSTYHVVDGKQRLLTIFEFIGNKFGIADDFSDPSLRGKKWSQLDKTAKQRLWNYSLTVEFITDVSDPFVNSVFERINRNSRRLVPQELRHAKYDGWFISLAEAEADKPEWRTFGVVTAARSKRMADIQFISELIGITIKKALHGFDQDLLDDLYADFDDLENQPEFIEDDFLSDFEKTKAFLRSLLESTPKAVDSIKVQLHMYTLWGFLVLESPGSVAKFSRKYSRFMKSVAAQGGGAAYIGVAPDENDLYKEAVMTYAANTRGASTDLAARQARHRALVAAMSMHMTATDEGQ